MLNELKIKCFLCVADTLNFTEAGKRLFMSQQAVSKHISNLEDDLGLELLHRTRNEVKLTSAGQRVCAFFSEATAQLSLLLSEIKQENHQSAINIRIGYQNWIDFGPAPGKAMVNIRKNTPDIHLIGERHTPARLLSLLDSGMLDIILLHNRFIPDKPGQFRLPLITTPMQIVVAKDNDLNNAPGDYTKFRNLPLLMDAFDNESENTTLMRAQNESKLYEFEPEKIIIVPNRDSIYTSAELGTGLYFGSSMATRSNSASLVYYDTDVMEVLYCVWQKKNKLLGTFARELQNEYKKAAEHFTKTGTWT